MRNAALVAICVIVGATSGTFAQSTPPASSFIAVSPNVNVLRGIHDPIRGDALLQRQNEPVAAVSTRNPSHLMIAANDYRTVDLANDVGIGDVLVRLARHVKFAAEKVVARLLGRKETDVDGDEEVKKLEAGTEAWIGLYLSNDGGKSYSSFFMPGFPQDASVSGRSTPAYGRQAASDPVLASAPAGRFYLGAMVFDRDAVTKKPTFSQIVVSRFTDRNNSETGQNFHFDGMTVVDDGKVSGRRFLDKPAIVADIARDSSDPAACGPMYIGFTVFDDKEKDALDRSKILVSASSDCGATFSEPKRISHRSTLNQGVTLAIRPSDGALFATYRSFSENKIFVTSSLDGGRSFARSEIVSGPSPILAFDQPTLGSADGYSFRTNGFPTLAIDGKGSIFVAWQERLVPNGSPRIVLTSSANGKTWTPRRPVERSRCVADDAGAVVCGEGEVGPQVMPALAFSRGRLMLLFYEARAHHDDVKWVASQKTTYITGLDTELNVRVAQLDANGRGASMFVNHYDTDRDGNVIPMIAKYGGREYRAANRANLPMYAGGSSAFMGDYISLAPTMPFVPAMQPASTPDTTTNGSGNGNRNGNNRGRSGNGSGRRDEGDDDKEERDKDRRNHPPPTPFWRWATEPTDAPMPAFVAVWGDNRDVMFPEDHTTGAPRIDGPWWEYAPPGFGPCINPGIRNANVYSAFVSPRLAAGTPTSFKQLGIQRAFVLYVQNQTTDHKFYRLTIVDSPPAVNGSFVQVGSDQNVLDVEV
ncbi:MAG: hypothetical protein AUH72_04385 [Acidobacteria bacterium 13_1_40CM_4_65_8]|nr:MAG: hypothetical protein AUH72_04385 [Acidobacteria bacterium 13_1_40CM_4_65_8]